MKTTLMHQIARLLLTAMTMLAITGTIQMIAPAAVSAAITTDPTQDSRCTMLSPSYYLCEVLISEWFEEEQVTTSQSCSLGWSSRKATQDVTSYNLVRVSTYQQEQHQLRLVGSEYIWYVFPPREYTTRTIELTDLKPVYGDCRPVTGRPPKN